MSWTLSCYVARRFLFTFLATFSAVFVLVVLVDMVELLRKSADSNVGFDTVILLAFMHAPAVTITAAPFTVLLAAMAAFARMARESELVVTRAAGVSVWRLTAPAVISAIFLGAVSFAVYNPVASAMSARFDSLEAKHFGHSTSRLMVSSEGLWLRQGSGEGQTVIHARSASGTVERLWQVTVFQFDADDKLRSRLNARAAKLEQGYWRLNGVLEWQLADLAGPGAGDGNGELAPTASGIATERDEIRLPTDLTRDRIVESFSDPQTISFWDLPDFISVLIQSGFSADRHLLHWHSLLAAPVVFAAMVLIGAAFSMRHARFGGLGAMALGCVIAGFVYYVLYDVAKALGASGTVPVVLAAWAPPASAVLLSLGLLLHLEDG